MGRTTTQWMADELGLALLTESESGAVRANATARERLGATPLRAMASAIASLVRVRPDDGSLATLLRRGRAGQRCADHLGDARIPVVCVPGEEGLEVLVDVRPRLTQEVLERAASAELSAMASHEVANALGAILGWAQLGLQGAPAASRNEALRQIERSARMTRDAVRELLASTKGGSVGRGAADARAVGLAVAAMLEPEARRRGLSIHTDELAACTAAATRSQLFTVLWNLAHNATQVLPAGGNVWLAARTRRGKVEIEVRDDGPGMTPETAARAFDGYFTTRVEGTGLGLAVVKRTVEAAQGKITLKTLPDRGTTFRVVLDETAEAAAPEPAVGLAAPAELDGSSWTTAVTGEPVHKISGVIERPIPVGTRVLVVEDNAPLRDLVRTALELRGAEVECASTAAEARATGGRFDVALVDLSLPDGRGDEVAAELRARRAVGAVGLMSGGDLPSNPAPGGDPDGWIRKPFEPEDLLAAVQGLVAVARAQSKSSLG